MSNLICPFCQQELDTGRYYVHCHNPECDTTVEMEGTEEMWEALIRTRKALEIAVDALNRIDKQLMTGIEMTSQARNALEQITALEQKD